MSERSILPLLAVGAAVVFVLAGKGRRRQAGSASNQDSDKNNKTPDKTDTTVKSEVPSMAARAFQATDPFVVIDTEAPKLGLDPRTIKAVMQAETGKKPFGNDGRVIIRFEPHVFARLTAAKKLGRSIRNSERGLIEAHGDVVLNPGMTTIWEGRKRVGGQEAEWNTLAKAQQIDPELAVQATSLGLGQIMGSNHKISGYNSAVSMLEAFQSSAVEQVLGMLRLIVAIPKQKAALQARDFASFVASYNGAPVGTANNLNYVKRMQQELAKLS